MTGFAVMLALFLQTAGSQPLGEPNRARLDAACDGCHQDVAAEWATSQHASAFSEAPFQAAWLREPRPFCRDCHAPLLTLGRNEEHALPRGVGCANCHLHEGAILAGEARGEGEAPHVLRRDPDLLGERSCAKCHEFAFPDGAFRDVPELMQSTLREHQDSPFASRRCVDCHMTVAPGGRKTHQFEASRDAALLASAVEVDVSREGETVRFRLRNVRAGHAVPTGDLFRRLALVLESDGQRSQTRFLARHFARRQQKTGVAVLAEVADTRIPADGTTRIVEFRVDPSAPIRWSLRHQRVAAPTSFEPSLFPLDGEIEMARGTLDP